MDLSTIQGGKYPPILTYAEIESLDGVRLQLKKDPSGSFLLRCGCPMDASQAYCSLGP